MLIKNNNKKEEENNMNTLEAIKTRKSVRNFTDKAVEIEKLKEIAQAGNAAAKAGKVTFNVITDANVLAAIGNASLEIMKNSGNDFLIMRASTPGFSPLYNAPAAIAVSAPATEDPIMKSQNDANIACAAENILLAATELGLGSCYVVAGTLGFMIPDIKALAKIPAENAVGCIVVIGYTEDTAPHTERKKNPDNIIYC